MGHARPGMPETFDLDLDHWPRRAAFEHFRALDNPYFNVALRLELGALVAALPQAAAGASLSLAYHHAVLRAANESEAFRLRLEGGRVRVHGQVDASVAVLRDDDSIAFAYLRWQPSFGAFVADAAPQLAATRRGAQPFAAGNAHDAVLHFTTLPWIDFTAFSHARNWRSDDSVPKFAFGRLCRDGDRSSMAFAVEVHHALMDGLHVGRLVQRVQQLLDAPEDWLRV